jgi:hypothetical protein
MTETERNLDLLLGDALAENERLKYEVKRQEIVIAQLLLAMHEGGTLRVRDAQHNGEIGTHGPDCWSWGPKHYECALRHINSITDDGK